MFSLLRPFSRRGPAKKMSGKNPARRLINDIRGSVALTFALTMPMVIAMSGMAVDYGMAFVEKTSLQQAADAAALAAAKELNLVNTDQARLESVAEIVARANLGGSAGAVSVKTVVQKNPAGVAVNLAKDVDYFILGHFAKSAMTVEAEAVARVAGETPICVLGLARSSGDTILLERSGLLTGNKCAVLSNSTSSRSINARYRARLTAEMTCSAGGYGGSVRRYAPPPLTDCPQIDDPLADRAAPPVRGCVAKRLVVRGGSRTLSPGTYCGGLTITDADIKLRPGIYVIKDGPLNLQGNTRFWGENVSFYLTGIGSILRIGPNTSIHLTAPKDGPMAGLLLFEDRKAKQGRLHTIRSNDARMLLGTLYLSRGTLVIDSHSKIADLSAYTALVLYKLKLFSGPHLVLNTDYSQTDIPVPDSVGGSHRSVFLAE